MLRRPGPTLLLTAALSLLGAGEAEARHRQKRRSLERKRAPSQNRLVATAHRRHLAWEPPPAGELPGGGVGWSDATGWNAAEARLGPIRRIPLDGLHSINIDPALTSKQPLLERADRRAVVLVHEDLDVTKPVDLLLHLHGFDAGYRQDRIMTKSDPVRDKDIDRFEEQMAEAGPQLVVLLPQGGLHAGFSPGPSARLCKAFDTGAFVDEVLERLSATRLLPGRPPALRLLLSAHSGGGEALGIMLEGAPQPQLVAFFDAVNGPREELPRLERWLLSRLSADLRALQGRDPEAQRRHLQGGLRFRAYYTASRLYLPLHDAPTLRFEQGVRPLRQFLEEWLGEHEAELGGPGGVAYEGLRQNYQVVDMPRASHGGLLGQGALRDALRSLKDEAAGITRSISGPPRS